MLPLFTLHCGRCLDQEEFLNNINPMEEDKKNLDQDILSEMEEMFLDMG